MPNIGTSQCRKLGRQTLDQVLFRLHHLCTHLTLGIHSLDLVHKSDMLGLLGGCHVNLKASSPPITPKIRCRIRHPA